MPGETLAPPCPGTRMVGAPLPASAACSTTSAPGDLESVRISELVGAYRSKCRHGPAGHATADNWNRPVYPWSGDQQAAGLTSAAGVLFYATRAPRRGGGDRRP